MKQIIFFMTLMLATVFCVTAQTNARHPTAITKPAAWKTWLLDNPQKITAAAPPLAAQAKAEIKAVRQAMSSLERKMSWHKSGTGMRARRLPVESRFYPGLTAQKQKFSFVLPGSWMNTAL
jgi:hypothetical protein